MQKISKGALRKGRPFFMGSHKPPFFSFKTNITPVFSYMLSLEGAEKTQFFIVLIEWYGISKGKKC